MTPSRIAVALTVLTLSATAWAEGPAARQVPSAVPATADGPALGVDMPEELPAELRIPAGLANATPTEAGPQASSPRAKVKSNDCGKSGCGYKAILGRIPICRDLALPGAPAMAVRLLPTSSALGGGDSTIVVRPDVQNGYGVHLAARF